MYEVNELGYGVDVYENIAGYAVVKVDGKIVKRFSNKKENAYGDAYRFASDIYYEKQRNAFNEHFKIIVVS
jgi:hypothetical protein